MQSIENEIIFVIFIGSTTFLLISLFFIILIILYQKRISQKQVELLKAGLNTQEEERLRIARDLHDELGPLLAGLKLQLELLKMPELSSEESAETLIKGQKTLDKAINELRNTAHDLMPVAFSDMGLIGSLQERCEDINHANQIQLILKTENYPEQLKKESELNIYRIIHEIINNVIKHSGASQCTIEIKSTNRFLYISCMDNGKGFDPAEGNRKGAGLKNIDSRVKLLNGQLTVTSKKEEGSAFLMQFEIDKLNG